MSTHPTILTELNELNSSLSGENLTGRPGSVPAGYFTDLPAQLMRRIRAMDGNDNEELATLSPLLAGISRNTPFTLPAGYFDELDPLVAVSDKDEVSPLLAGLKKNNPFTVPEGFFGKMQMPSVTGDLSELEELSPLLAGLSRRNVYSVPQGYFEQLSPLLQVIDRVNIYDVPAGYFENLNPLEVVGQSTPARVITMRPVKWLRYAAAAVLVAAISVSAVLFINKGDSAAAVSDTEIAKAVKNVPTEQIDELVDLAEEQQVYASNATDAAEISKLIQNVPDQDIQDFLNETESLESDMDDDIILN